MQYVLVQTNKCKTVSVYGDDDDLGSLGEHRDFGNLIACLEDAAKSFPICKEVYHTTPDPTSTYDFDGKSPISCDEAIAILMQHQWSKEAADIVLAYMEVDEFTVPDIAWTNAMRLTRIS